MRFALLRAIRSGIGKEPHFGAKGKHTYNSGVESASKGAEYTKRGGKCYAGSIRRSGERKPKRNFPTTIVACRLEGRNYIGFEKNEENYKIASEADCGVCIRGGEQKFI